MNVRKNNIIRQSAAKILSYHYNDNMNKVQRLSRKRVDIENCYFNYRNSSICFYQLYSVYYEEEQDLITEYLKDNANKI